MHTQIIVYKLSYYKNIIICRKPDNQFVSENQEAANTSKLREDKRSRIEELSQDTDVISKRPKIISTECITVMQNASSMEQNCLERIEANNI